MAGGRRGLVAPQNTFLENIVRRSNGKGRVGVPAPRLSLRAFIADADAAEARRGRPGSLGGWERRAGRARVWRAPIPRGEVSWGRLLGVLRGERDS